MTLYDKGTEEHGAVVNRMMEKYHGGLRDAGVTVGVLLAFATTDRNGDPVGDALLLHGVPCAAIVRIVPYKLRVQELPDAEIVIDERRWEEMSPEERDALIDHELQHLELQVSRRRKDKGQVLRDDCGRPKLKMRKHDFELGGFHVTVQHHGVHSIEYQAVDKLAIASNSPVKQQWIQWTEARVPTRVGGGRRGKDAAVKD